MTSFLLFFFPVGKALHPPFFSPAAEVIKYYVYKRENKENVKVYMQLKKKKKNKHFRTNKCLRGETDVSAFCLLLLVLFPFS
jgi:hypothetical protein